MGLLDYAEVVLGQCGTCRASDEVLHIPIAGASTASPLSEKLRVGVLFLDDPIALCATDVCSKYSSLMPVRPKNSWEAWGVFRSSRIAILVRPTCIHMGGWGEWEMKFGQMFARRAV